MTCKYVFYKVLLLNDQYWKIDDQRQSDKLSKSYIVNIQVDK